MVDFLNILSENANWLYSIVIVGSMVYAGITVFAKWIGNKFLSKFDQRIDAHKNEMNVNIKKQEDLLYDTASKFDVSITRLSTEFQAVGKTVSKIEGEVRDINHDVHNISDKVNEHLIKSGIKWSELDNKLSHHGDRIDNIKEKVNNFVSRDDFMNFMNRQDRERKEEDNNNNNKK